MFNLSGKNNIILLLSKSNLFCIVVLINALRGLIIEFLETKNHVYDLFKNRSIIKIKHLINDKSAFSTKISEC